MVTLIHAGQQPGTEAMKGSVISVYPSSVRVWRKSGWVTVDEYYALYPTEHPDYVPPEEEPPVEEPAPAEPTPTEPTTTP